MRTRLIRNRGGRFPGRLELRDEPCPVMTAAMRSRAKVMPRRANRMLACTQTLVLAPRRRKTLAGAPERLVGQRQTKQAAGFPSPAKRRACLRVGRKGQPASGPCGQFQQVEDPLLGRQ